MKHDTERMSVKVPIDVKARWMQVAKKRGISRSELIRRATAEDNLKDRNSL